MLPGWVLFVVNISNHLLKKDRKPVLDDVCPNISFYKIKKYEKKTWKTWENRENWFDYEIYFCKSFSYLKTQ